LSSPPAVARKDGERVRFYSRSGKDLTYRLIVVTSTRDPKVVTLSAFMRPVGSVDLTSRVWITFQR
jgi:hypothetical protein